MEGKSRKGRNLPKFKKAVPEEEQGKPARPDVSETVKSSITIDGTNYQLNASDLKFICNLGHGNYGVVDKMEHQETGKHMAVKRIRAQVSSDEDKRLLMDLDVTMRTTECVYTVQFFGSLFQEGDVWICMELMDESLDKFIKKVIEKGQLIPENILGRLAYVVVSALNFLKSKLNVIHRDVKPSNILINRTGQIKLCDFGISGKLVDSIAKTKDAGSRPYMAPERIDPEMMSDKGYDVKSDIWSLGITMIELATGVFPYAKWQTPFAQLKQVVKEPSPKLPDGKFSDDLVQFIDLCLKKDHKERPRYESLLKLNFIEMHKGLEEATVGEYVISILDS
ncbi:dual specificity mitogen-activated protein kinase kinase 6-like [Anneissia japonica]|uniref:dual specificity mitogen-activated protein kinase kinase 6-like n=1 Tax=Anneissia japonica TaxID=1529436 RepID=UPI0014257B40|nr:dual specificity mitogen-activated protein kinase kinase 6-like [Anneissia japonica]